MVPGSASSGAKGCVRARRAFKVPCVTGAVPRIERNSNGARSAGGYSCFWWSSHHATRYLASSRASGRALRYLLPGLASLPGLPYLPRAEVLSTPTGNQICASLSCFHCFFHALLSFRLIFLSPFSSLPRPPTVRPEKLQRSSSVGSLRGPLQSLCSGPSQLLAACLVPFLPRF